MAVRMIAVDMDGTFLDENKQYNVQRFSRQYALLKEKGIHFVVASGNQYYQLQRYFPDIKNEIAFVAENGAWVSHGDEVIFCGELAKKGYTAYSIFWPENRISASLFVAAKVLMFTRPCRIA